MAPIKTRSYEAYPRFRCTTLGEWPDGSIQGNVPSTSSPCAKGVASPTTKKCALGSTASPVYEAGSSSTPVAVPLNIAPEIVGVVSPKNSLSILRVAPSKSITVAPSYMPTSGALNRTHRLHPLYKRKAVMVDRHCRPPGRRRVCLAAPPVAVRSPFGAIRAVYVAPWRRPALVPLWRHIGATSSHRSAWPPRDCHVVRPLPVHAWTRSTMHPPSLSHQ
uniref:Uncharacterized protein n=1 Tax=Oryza punctata TaxID=4537 RepID=A0A0E0M6I6_ORYPU